MHRLVLSSAVAVALAVTGGAAAKSWPSVEFRPAAAKPGDLLSVRVSLTPQHYVAPPRPGGPRIEIVLVPARLAASVTSVDEPGVVRAAVIRTDINWRGAATFRLPELPAGRYVGAYRIAGAFYAPRAHAPLDNHGFSLRVLRSESERSVFEPLAIAASLALVTVLLVRRGRVPLPLSSRR